MAIFTGLFGSTSRYVRADSMPEAIRTMRAAFGFAPKGYIKRAGDNAHAVGSALAYDTAANTLEGGNHRALRAQRKASRARHANGKGAAIPAGVEILQF